MNIFSRSNQSISVVNGVVTVNGKRINLNDIKEKEVNIICNGDAGDIKVDVCNTIEIKGNCKKVDTMSGDVSCGDVTGSVTTMSGDVEANTIGGDVSTMSGDIRK